MNDLSISQSDPSGKSLLRTEPSKSQLAAMREHGKIERRALTDAIQAFCEYVDPKGNKSTAPGKAYINMTRSIYAAFGLNKKQIDAKLQGDTYGRDRFAATEILFVQLAERTVSQVLWFGMEAKKLRSEIKKDYKAAIRRMKETFGWVLAGDVSLAGVSK